MPNTTRIVFIGAGSAAFGLSLFQDLFSTTELAGSTLTLVDTNPDALDRMAALAEVLNRRGNAGITIEKTTDRRAALQGAGFVLCAIAIDRNRLWKLDFEVPKKKIKTDDFQRFREAVC